MNSNIAPAGMKIAQATERSNPPLELVKSWGATSIPFNQEAEEALIGGILIAPDMYFDVANFFRAEDFYILRNKYIYEAMGRIVDRKEPIDYMTVFAELKAHNQIEEVGGAAYLMHLLNSTPTSTHTTIYAHMVKRAATRRRLMVASDHIKGLAVNEEMELSQVIQEAESKLLDVTEDYTGQDTVTLGQAMSTYFEHIEHLVNNPNMPTGIPTGFKEIDKVLGGLWNGDLTLIGGRPGMGKSALLLCMALLLAKAGKRVAYFSMEMPIHQLVNRLSAMEAGVNVQTLRTGKLTPPEWARFVKASGELSKLPILLDDTTNWTPPQLHAKVASMVRRLKIDVVMVDYIQLMNGGGRYKDNRQAELGYISKKLKEMALEFDRPVICPAQLGRQVEQRQDKRPLLSDLREAGDLEQNADNVLFLYRDEVYNEASEFPNQADVIVAKQRNGPTGTVSLYFEKTLTKFLNAAERSVDLSKL